MMYARIIAVLTSILLLAGGVQAADNSHAKLIHFFSGPEMPADGSDVKGSSAKLTRGDGVVWMRINTTGLEPGAYTNWWIIFNNPSACVDGCSSEDLDPTDDVNNPDHVNGSVGFATGGVVGLNGVGHFRAAPLAENDTDGFLFGPGLLSAQNAEIHYVIRYHGAAGMGDLLQEQISSVNGGCDGPMGDVHLAHRLFACYDPQATALPFP